MKITDASIESVPLVESSVLPVEYWNKLQCEHKELLQSVRTEPIGTERIRAFDLKMGKLGDSLGAPGDNRVSIIDFNRPHILIHNHADSSSISLGDFESFVKRPNSISLHAVGHDGSVSVIEKLSNYDAAGAIHKYIGVLEIVHDLLRNEASIGEISGVVEQFLATLSENGFIYRRWK